MYYELGQMHGQMREMWAEVGHTRVMTSDILAQLEQIRAELAAHDARTMLLLWELLREDGEEIGETRRRVLTNLSPATGDMRLFQLASAQLLFEFDAFCKSHGLTYWLQSGTLLGAARHEGFIPWDDDLDVGMLRKDIECAIELVKTDSRFDITVRYDYYVYCRQIRFKYADPSIPCFIDLFVFDPVTELGRKTLSARELERAALEEDLSADKTLHENWNEANQFVDEGTPDAGPIRAVFDEHISNLYQQGFYTDDLDEAEGIVWAIDNVNSGVSHHSWYITPLNRMFPLAEMVFEGHELSVPNDSEYCLEAIFGDIYSLPPRMSSYFDHLLGDVLKDSAVKAKLERLSRETRAEGLV